MRAIQMLGHGKVAVLDDVPRPEPQEGEVLVQVRYAAICGSNIAPYTSVGRWAEGEYPKPPGWDGHENVGTIVESRLAGWEPGTVVLAHPQDYCGFADFIRARPPGLVRLPEEGDPAPWIAAQPLATVLRAMNRTGPVIGQRCAVVGQGPMGLVFTHLLGRLGAAEVIGIDLLAWRLEWARRLGATHVVDASATDPVEAVRELTGGEMVDFAVEAVGFPDALDTAARLPRRFGRLMVFGVPRFKTQVFPLEHVFRSEMEAVASVGGECVHFFNTAVEMMVQGRVDIGAMVRPRVPFAEAARAFEMYANREEGTLKLVLELEEKRD